MEKKYPLKLFKNKQIEVHPFKILVGKICRKYESHNSIITTILTLLLIQ